MQITTKLFGEVDIADEKILHFENGIIGFPDLTDFALMHDSENTEGVIRWLQSMQEPAFAMPVMDPLIVSEEYNPQVEDELLKPLGDLNPDELLVLCTLTVPSDIEKMSVNLRAPIIIHTETRRAVQIILDDDKYEVKHYIYDLLRAGRKGGE